MKQERPKMDDLKKKIFVCKGTILRKISIFYENILKMF